MNEIKTLFSQQSIGELVILLFTVVLAVQAVWRIIDFFLEKYRKQTGKTIDKIQWEKDLTSSMEEINGKIDALSEQNEQTHRHQEQTESTVALLQERMQENTRSYLIDAHHKFCYQFKQIDDLNLESLERRYLYYKTSGGDTFIDHLMEEVRALPRVDFYGDKRKEE